MIFAVGYYPFEFFYADAVRHRPQATFVTGGAHYAYLVYVRVSFVGFQKKPDKRSVSCIFKCVRFFAGNAVN